MQGIENGDGVRHGVPYREHSFLSNERLSPAIRLSRVNVSFYGGSDGGGGGVGGGSSGGGGGDGAGSAAAVAVPGTARLPRGATDREVPAALGPNRSRPTHTDHHR